MDNIDLIEFLFPFIILLIILLIIINIIYIARKIIYKDFENLPFYKKPTIWLLFALFIIPIIYLSSSIYFNIKANIYKNNYIKSVEKNTQIKTTAVDLISDFSTNFSKAEVFYKDKMIQITGTINYIGVPKDNPPNKDNSYIEFSVSENNYIICYFTNNILVPSYKFERENTAITIIGKYRQHEVTKYGRYIYLEYCDIVED